MARSDRALRAFARLLPREFRERVFDPAFSDLRREEIEGGAARKTRQLRRTLLVLESLRLVVLFALWRHRRPTRLASALILILGIAAVVVQRIRYEGPRRHNPVPERAAPAVPPRGTLPAGAAAEACCQLEQTRIANGVPASTPAGDGLRP